MKNMSQQSLVLEQKTNQEFTSFLGLFLSDTYVLYVKTQNFHWNIVDPRFYFLHKMLEEQYRELAEAADLIAERIRALNEKSPGSMNEFLRLSSLREAEEKVYTGDEMIQILAEDHEALSRCLQEKVDEASKLHDDGTVDILISRIRSHDKTAWLLRSHL